jgi:hypothetical protein
VCCDGIGRVQLCCVEPCFFFNHRSRLTKLFSPVDDKGLSWLQFTYSLRFIILFTNIDVSRYILVIDTSILAKSNVDQREYLKSF